jgi:hypothetical protein
MRAAYSRKSYLAISLLAPFEVIGDVKPAAGLNLRPMATAGYSESSYILRVKG